MPALNTFRIKLPFILFLIVRCQSPHHTAARPMIFDLSGVELTTQPSTNNNAPPTTHQKQQKAEKEATPPLPSSTHCPCYCSERDLKRNACRSTPCTVGGSYFALGFALNQPFWLVLLCSSTLCCSTCYCLKKRKCIKGSYLCSCSCR